MTNAARAQAKFAGFFLTNAVKKIYIYLGDGAQPTNNRLKLKIISGWHGLCIEHWAWLHKQFRATRRAQKDEKQVCGAEVKLGRIGGAVILGVLLASSAADASIITDAFVFRDSSNNVVAQGSFSYDSSLSGDLGYGNLDSFHITIKSQTYDLAFVDTLANNYVYFDYNTLSNLFVPADVHGNLGTFGELMGAVQGNEEHGFFLDPLPNQTNHNNDGDLCIYPACNGPSDYLYAVSQSTTRKVPEPPTLALLGAALFGLSLLYRRKRRIA